jgi:hypothetical protein
MAPLAAAIERPAPDIVAIIPRANFFQEFSS